MRRAKPEARCHSLFQVAFGWIAASYTERGVAALSLPKPSPGDALGALALAAESDVDCSNDPFGIMRLLAAYFGGAPTDFFSVPLDVRPYSPFYRRVWDATRNIPYGQTCSYQWLAEECGVPRGARAIGQAMARNPVPVLVPCHRVVGSDGRLHGFGGGLELKRRMLEIEGITDLRI